jgi:putative molybdopterin biosynthesis protein
MLPGKPVMVGNIDGKPVIGLPGYPVAAQTVLREIVVRLLVHWGFPFPQEILLPVKIARNMPSELGYDEFIPVSVGNVNGTAWAFPHPRGSGIQMALVRANGYIHISSGMEGKEAGTRLDAHLTAAPHMVDRVLLCTGVHEPAIDMLGNLLANENIFLHFFTAWNGGACIALRNNSCSAAAIAMPDIGWGPDEGHLHLLDGVDVVHIHLADAEQGIVSRNGITRDDLIKSRIINTKRGSTTRMVLDWLLSRDGIHPDQLAGYSREVKSPEAVVHAIRNGSADAGICSSSIATPSGLSFIPLVRETLDLYLRSESLDDIRIQRLMTVIKSPEYLGALEKNGRYLTDRTGQVRRAIPSGKQVPCSGSDKISATSVIRSPE